MEKYTLIKRYHYDRRLKIYMHAIMYVDAETMAEENFFTAEKKMLKLQYNVNSRTIPKKIGLDLVLFVHNIMSFI